MLAALVRNFFKEIPDLIRFFILILKTSRIPNQCQTLEANNFYTESWIIITRSRDWLPDQPMRKIAILSIFFPILASVFTAEAQVNKEWLDKLSPMEPGPYEKMRPAEISFILSWKGRMNAGKLNFALSEPYPGVFLTKASGQSIGFPRVLFPYDFTGTAQTKVDTLTPLTFDFDDKMKKRTTKYSLLFQPGQMISHTELTDRKSGKKTPYHQIYRFDKDVARDLTSSMLYLRSLPLRNGDKISTVIATFNKPYLVDIEVLGRENKSIKRKKHKAIKLDLKISKIHANMAIENYKKIERATIWMSDDDFRLPLEFQGEIFIGYISAQISSRKWL